MFNSNLYKKHYPIQSPSDLYEMSEKDRKKLAEWIYDIETDVRDWNYRSALHGSIRGIEIKIPGGEHLLRDFIENQIVANEINKERSRNEIGRGER